MTHQSLLTRLKASIDGMGLSRVQFGLPELVIKEVQKAETLFKDFSKAKPSSQDAYMAALSLLRGETIDDWSLDLVAAAITIPIKEQGGITVLESNYFDDLLKKYENDAYSGDLWRLTWYSLLNSYLTFDLSRTKTDAGMNGFAKLSRLLNRTWPSIDKQSGNQIVPDWVRILRQENQLLSDSPVDKYAQDFLDGKTEHIKAVAENLGIPANSWFWQELVLGAVRHATQKSDEEFRGQILMLIELVKSAPVYRDKAIAEILNRYFKCANRVVHPELRDFVIHSSVWRNPKLKVAGIATAWNQVPESVWQMVMGWVNERNLKDFFDILAARRNADHGRLKFWSRYINQISWTRLVFGSETIWQKNHNPGIRALLESEEGTYAKLLGASDKELDAFLMQIGEYIFVEFSKTGNGAYAYRASNLAFNLYANSYEGSTSDLKCGYYTNGRGVAKILHTPGWEDRTAATLAKLGIYPDRSMTRHEPNRSRLSSDQTAALGKINDLTLGDSQTATEHPSLSNKNLSETSTNLNSVKPSNSTSSGSSVVQERLSVDDMLQVVAPYPGVTVIEKGFGDNRRLWVTAPDANSSLISELKKLGFRWSSKRESWYLVED